MNRVFVGLALFTASVAAQVAPAPAEMTALDRMVGAWLGEGSGSLGPKGPSMTWTSRAHVTKVMGGHFLREETILDLGAPLNQALGMITYWAYDSQRKEFVQYSVSSGGDLQVNPQQRVDADTFVSTSIVFREGNRNVERWTTKFVKDHIEILGETAQAPGGFWTMVKGVAKKATEPVAVDLSKLGAFMAPPAAEMKRLESMVGHYRVVGTYAMAPGQKTEFTGTEDVESLFGGMVIVQVPFGDEYEGFTAMVWNARETRYERFALNTWGLHALETARWVDDTHLRFDGTMDVMGQHMTMRTIVTVDKTGRPIKSSAHTLSGIAPPFESFTCTHQVAEKKSEK